MSAKNQAKLVLFLLVALVSLPIAWFGLRAFASFITYFNQGADPASIFRGNVLRLPQNQQARWLDFHIIQGELPTSAQREELLAAYWGAWQAYERAIQTDNASDLATYWASAAYERTLVALGAGARQLSTDQHHLRLRFFSRDGSVAQIESLFRLRYTDDQRVQHTLRLNAILTLSLDKGFWRIHQLSLKPFKSS